MMIIAFEYLNKFLILFARRVIILDIWRKLNVLNKRDG
jgi:hypothetical protein